MPFASPTLRRISLFVQASPTEGPSTPDEVWPHEPHGALLDGANSNGTHMGPSSPPAHWFQHVEELSIEGSDFFALACRNPYQTFTRLRILHLGAVSSPISAVLALCARMPRLESLSLVFRDSVDASAPPSSVNDGDSTPTLHSLGVLRLSGASSQIEQVLAALDSPALHTATLSVAVHAGDTDGWTRVCALLAARCAPSLRSLRAELRQASARVVPTAAPRPFADAVRPLLALHVLRHCTLALRDPAGVAMDDADVAAMGEAWPALEALDVVLPEHGRGTRPSITSAAVLTRACPALKTLRMPFSADLSNLPCPRPSGDGENVESLMRARLLEDMRRIGDGLRNLWVYGACFSRAESSPVIAFLRGCFPNVDLRPMVNAGVLHVR